MQEAKNSSYNKPNTCMLLIKPRVLNQMKPKIAST